jgi:hypothetical protein
MKIYKVPVEWSHYGDLKIKAKDMEDLMEKLHEPCFLEEFDTPKIQGYVESSLQVIDWDEIEEIEEIDEDNDDYISF